MLIKWTHLVWYYIQYVKRYQIITQLFKYGWSLAFERSASRTIWRTIDILLLHRFFLTWQKRCAVVHEIVKVVKMYYMSEYFSSKYSIFFGKITKHISRVYFAGGFYRSRDHHRDDNKELSNTFGKHGIWGKYFEFFPRAPFINMDQHNPKYKVWDEIIYPFPYFKGAVVEVWEWICNFIPLSQLPTVYYHTISKITWTRFVKLILMHPLHPVQHDLEPW